MAALKDFADLANNFGNKILNFPFKFSQNAAPLAKVDISNSEALSKLGLGWLFNHAPGFCLNSKQVKIIYEPRSFYNTLTEQIQKANRRIVLASLYLGTGKLERQLVLHLKKKLEINSNVAVKILLDCTRGSRGEINSRQILIPLLKSYHKSCQVALYQTPFLQGLLYPYLPAKYKEIVGLQHIKIYLFDNNVILTGANLSNDYFTNRQDRYMLITNCKELSDFIEGLVDKISEFSLHLDADNKLKLAKTWLHDPNKTDPNVFNFAASESIRNYCEKYRKNNKYDLNDTIIFPLLEMGPFNIHTDSEVTSRILKNCGPEEHVCLTTGYFNLPQLYINMIIDESKANYRILMAHPEANGFYKAKGPASGIPYAYTHLALKFLCKVKEKHQNDRIKVLEYKRFGWTYHAKGLWLSSFHQQPPFLTMIGSPNFGERSLNHDLECQFLLVTADDKLQKELSKEKEALFESCQPFTKDISRDPSRKTPLWVRIVIRLFKTYL